MGSPLRPNWELLKLLAGVFCTTAVATAFVLMILEVESIDSREAAAREAAQPRRFTLVAYPNFSFIQDTETGREWLSTAGGLERIK